MTCRGPLRIDDVEIDRLDIDHATNNAPPRRRSTLPPFTPGFAWNSTTQEFIEILPEGHPNYRENREIVSAAIRRWNAGTSRKWLTRKPSPQNLLR